MTDTPNRSYHDYLNDVNHSEEISGGEDDIIRLDVSSDDIGGDGGGGGGGEARASEAFEDAVEELTDRHSFGESENGLPPPTTPDPSSKERRRNQEGGGADLPSAQETPMQHDPLDAEQITPIAWNPNDNANGDGLPNLTPNEVKSFVNGLLSPFSPLLKRLPDKRDKLLGYVSLKPCRKVSVVVRVTETAATNGDAQKESVCVFPNVRSAPSEDVDTSAYGAGGGDDDVPRPHPGARDLIIVKPEALGTRIPTQVTMETAKLVAQVADISSEDWARLYEFHQVWWPQQDQGDSATAMSSAASSLPALSRAVAQDALVECQSSVVFSMGNAATCWTNSTSTSLAPSSFGDDGNLLARILADVEDMMEEKNVCTISLLELSGDEEGNVDGGASSHERIHDVLDPSNDTKLKLRHYDMKGAVVQNLSQVIIGNNISSTLWTAVANNLKKRRRQQKRLKKPYSGPIAMVATISVWANAVQHELGKPATCHITCVELVSDERSGTGTIRAMPATSKIAKSMEGREETRLTAEKQRSQRKGVVTLGSTLRALFLKSSMDCTEPQPPISYRESALTKILQRYLEEGKIVVVASVSPLSSEYDATLCTLNYARRLLVPPGTTASSPFKRPNSSGKHTHKSLELDGTPLSQHLKATVGEGAILRHLVSDPRQRLAKVFKEVAQSPGTGGASAASTQHDEADVLSPSAKPKTGETPTPFDEDETETYEPIDYMDSLQTSNGSPLPADPALRMSPLDRNSGRSQPWSPELVGVNPSGRRPSMDDEEHNEGRMYPVRDFSESRYVEAIPDGVDDAEDDFGAFNPDLDQSSLNYSRESKGHEPSFRPNSRNDGPISQYVADENDQNERMEFRAIPEHDVNPASPVNIKPDKAKKSQYPHPDAIAPTLSQAESASDGVFPSSSNDADGYDSSIHSNQIDGLPIRNQPTSAFDVPSRADSEPTEDSPLKEYLNRTKEEPDGDYPASEDEQQQQYDAAFGVRDDSEPRLRLEDESAEGDAPGQLAESPLRPYLGQNEDIDPSESTDIEYPPAAAAATPPNDERAIHGSRYDSARSPGNDPNNNSSWMEWNSENSGDGDLGLEPQSPQKYESPSILRRIVETTAPGQDVEVADDRSFLSRQADTSYSKTDSRSRKDDTLPTEYSMTSQRSMLSKISSGKRRVSSRVDAEVDIDDDVYSSRRLVSPPRRLRPERTSALRAPADYLREGHHDGDGDDDTEDLRTDGPASTQPENSDILYGEIDVLEEAIYQIKNVHRELWKSSASSLLRLRDSRSAQMESITRLISERDRYKARFESTRDDLRSVSDAHQKNVQHLEEELRELLDKLEKSNEERHQLEKIADEALTAHDTMERKVRNVEGELTRVHSRIESGRKENRDLKSQNDQLTEQLQDAKRRMKNMLADSQNESKERLELSSIVKRLQGDVDRVAEERRVERAHVRSLEDRIREYESSQRRLEDELAHVQSLRQEDLSKLAGLQNMSKEYSDSLDRLTLEKEHLENTSRRDTATINKLQEEIEQLSKFLSDARKERIELERTKRIDQSSMEKLQVEFDHFKLSMKSMQVKSESLEARKVENEATINRLNEEVIHYRNSLSRLEKEHASCAQLHQQDVDTINRLRLELRDIDLMKKNYEDALQDIKKVKREKFSLESALADQSAELADKIRDKEMAVARHKKEIEEFKLELSSVKERFSLQTADNSNEIALLREQISKLKNEISALKTERDDALLDLNDSETRFHEYTAQLRKQDESIAKYRKEAARLQELVTSVRDRETAHSTAADRAVRRLQQEVADLTAELSEAGRKNDETMQRFESHTRSYQSLSDDYKAAQAEVLRLNTIIEDLTDQVSVTRTRNDRGSDRIRDMETAISDIKIETRRKINQIAAREQEALRNAERRDVENDRLRNNNRDLLLQLRKLQMERDAYSRALEIGRERVARITSRSEGWGLTGGPGSMIFDSIPELGMDSAHDYDHEAMSELNAETIVSQGDPLPELFVTRESSEHTRTVPRRSEEIAACLAASLHQTHTEHTRLQHKMQEQKEAEVAQLQKQIQHLQVQLGTPRSSHLKPDYHLDEEDRF